MPQQPYPPEYSNSHTDDMQTVHGVISWLEAIANDGDCMIDRDNIVDTCAAAAKRLQSMQQSLIQEVERIEKLQPFYTHICAYVDGVRKQT